MIKLYDRTTPPTENEKQKIANFLFEHLDEFGDPQPDIEKAIHYATGKENTPGGLLIAHWNEDDILGAVVLNKTGMKGYIPENILVYIATHSDHRGKGIGKKLMNAAITQTDGDIALHVEPDNPARQLYEQLGFTNKYLEMRLKKEN
jgi:GNAT superfamily N-acetyltransferase